MELIQKNKILRYPRLDTVLMVEKAIQEHDGECTRKQLWEALPKKMMYQTFQVILVYLYQSNKISVDSEGKIGWIFYPKRLKERVRKSSSGFSHIVR
ncbi:MAG: hypothetical protein HZB67_04845 [Candidatus Aenigmarchaeota archaeon]|nr:hypothetical protein [Candidatus Aenigmarchaeota archaeon]